METDYKGCIQSINNFIRNLPERIYFSPKSEVDYYGIRNYVAKKNKEKRVTGKSYNCWKHGWYYYDKYIDTKNIVHYNHYCYNYLVTNDCQKVFLNKNGFKNVFAVGMPFIYIDKVESFRLPNSLLIMPAHTLSYTDISEFKHSDFFLHVIELKKTFKIVAVCFHSNCFNKYEFLIDALEAEGVHCISGANITDANSLVRMRYIFDSFEYMTSNSIGSHIVYAAYCGCKVSISGKYVNASVDDYRRDIFYQLYPAILNYVVNFNQEENIKKLFPFLFVKPSEATTRIDWASKELGAHNKKSYEEIHSYINSSYLKQVVGFSLSILNNCFDFKKIKSFFKVRLWMFTQRK